MGGIDRKYPTFFFQNFFGKVRSWTTFPKKIKSLGDDTFDRFPHGYMVTKKFPKKLRKVQFDFEGVST